MPAITLPAKASQDSLAMWALRLVILGAVVLGALHAWAAASSYSMNADGISYLDIGDAYWKGDWKTAINPVWSPLYSWILGGAMRIFQPGMRMEFPLVHMVNYLIYLLTLASFSYFWKQVSEYRQARLASLPDREEIIMPGWAFNALGYLLFTWTALTLIEIWAVTPDMLMAAIVYLAGAILLRMRMHTQSWLSYVLLGLLLGVGYLAKSIMLPVSFLILGASLFTPGSLRRVYPRVLIALFVFLLIITPYVALISLAKGSLTFGESGAITFLRHVNKIPFPHWQGGEDISSTPIHPSRMIFSDPAIYEFGEPIGGTYPISYDPSYWYAGVQPSYRLNQILTSFLSNTLVYLGTFLNQLGPLMAGILILYLLAKRRYPALLGIIRHWSLALISVLMLILYSLVYVEGRYIAVFIVLLLADLLANLSLPDQIEYKKVITAVSLVMILSLVGNLVASNLDGYARLAGKPVLQAGAQSAPPPSWPGEVAEELQLLGIQPGDRVAVIGYAYDSYWARLARVKIVAEMLDVDANPFWFGSTALQQEIIQAFQNTGAKAIVAEATPSHASLTSWHQVVNTNVYIYLFDE